jgi:phosphoribosylformimino-5-aminoimidazole carboxamide ribotide isomerase
VQLIPAVDVLDGRVVRLMHGDYDRVTVYADDPVAQAAAFCAEGAELVHVVDLAGARDGVASEDLWRRLAAAGVPFQVGGGIRNAAAAERAVTAGAQRAVLGTAAVWQPDVLEATVRTIGADRVVAALDVRDGKATGAGWLDEGKALPDVVVSVVEAGVRRALVTGIGRDGTMRGPDLDVIAAVRAAGPELAVIGSGGVGELDDVVVLAQAGVDGAIIGRALYEGRFTVSEALAAIASPT